MLTLLRSKIIVKSYYRQNILQTFPKKTKYVIEDMVSSGITIDLLKKICDMNKFPQKELARRNNGNRLTIVFSNRFKY